MKTCKTCKFWDSDPNNEDGVCWRTPLYGDEVVDTESKAISFFHVEVTRVHDPDEDEDPIGTFINGAPFEDILARRMELNLDKLDIRSWLSTTPDFGCNQWKAIKSKCDPSFCSHCYGKELNDTQDAE